MRKHPCKYFKQGKCKTNVAQILMRGFCRYRKDYYNCPYSEIDEKIQLRIKICRRCGEFYKTHHKNPITCDNCNKKNVKNKIP